MKHQKYGGPWRRLDDGVIGLDDALYDCIANYDANLVTMPDGARKIESRGAVGGMDATCYTGRAIELTGTAYVDIPLDHTLGERYAENPFCSIAGDENTCSYDSAEKKWSIHVETTTEHTYSPYLRYYADSDETANQVYKITVIVTCTRGSAYVNNLEAGDGNGSWDIFPIRYAMSEGETKKWEHTSYFKPNSTPTQRNITVTFDGENYPDFDAEVELILEPITATGDIIYFDAEQRKHIAQQVVSTHYRLENLTCNSITSLKIGKHFTEEDIAKLDKEPELLARLALGDTDMGLSLQPEDIKHCFVAGEKEWQYLFDLKTVSLSDNLISNGTFDNDLSGWAGNTDWWEVIDGRAHHPATNDNKSIRPAEFDYPEISGLFMIDFDLEIVSNAAKVEFKDMDGNYAKRTFVDSGHKTIFSYRKIFAFLRDYNPDQDSEFYIDNVVAREVLGAVAEIKNYSQPIRDNADQLPYGLQLIKFKQNEIGAPTEYVADEMEFSDDGRYVQSQMIPDTAKAVSLEAVFGMFAESGVDQSMGSDTLKISIPANTTDSIDLALCDATITESVPDKSFVHVVITGSGTGTAKTYINGALSSTASYTPGSGTISFSIGPDWTNSVKHVRVFDVELTESEVAALYRDATTKYQEL